MTAQATPLQTVCMGLNISVNVFQTVAILGMMTVAWPEVFQTTTENFQVFLLDLESFRLACLAGGSSWSRWALSAVICPVASLWLLLVHAISQCLPRRKRKLPKTLNTIGVFLEAGFATMSAVGMQPLMCYSHPNGLNSVLKYPGVICGESEHILMLVFGIALLCFTLCFLTSCFYACWKMPFWSLTSRHSLTQSFRFLTSKFRMDAWWFGVLLPLRSFFLSFSVVVATDLPPAQAAAAAVILAFYGPFQSLMWPWKAPAMNKADLWLNLCLLLLVNSSVVGVGVGNFDLETWEWFGSTYAMTFMIGLALGVLFMAGSTGFVLFQRHVLQRGCREWTDPHCKEISGRVSHALKQCAEDLLQLEIKTLQGELMRMNPSDLHIITSAITLIAMDIGDSANEQLFHTRVAMSTFNHRLTRQLSVKQSRGSKLPPVSSPSSQAASEPDMTRAERGGRGQVDEVSDGEMSELQENSFWAVLAAERFCNVSDTRLEHRNSACWEQWECNSSCFEDSPAPNLFLPKWSLV